MFSWGAALSVALLQLAGGPAADPPRRVALLVGISDYQHFTLSGPAGQSDLRGPANDVPRMQASLLRFGFKPGAHMKILQDEAASREGIADGFRWLAQQVRDERDVVVIFFAGHGSSTPDTDGDEARLAAGDSKDEALVPWDARDIRDASQLITDDSINVWLGALRTKNVTVIVDACFSGTITRELGNATPRGPVDDDDDVVAEAEPGATGMNELPYAVITAAHAGQTALETDLLPMPQPHVGVFTYEFTRALDVLPATATYDDVLARVRLAVAARGARQVPQLEGQGSARMFGLSEGVTRRAFAEVQRPLMLRPFLPIGLAHGVRAGASYDVYDSTETEFTKYPNGKLRIDSVSIGQAFFTQLEPDEATPLPRGARAVLSTVPLGVSRLTRTNVFVRPAVGDKVRDAIAAFPFVSIVSDTADAHVRIEGSPDAVEVRVHNAHVVPLDSAWLVKQGVPPHAARGIKVPGAPGAVAYAPEAAALCSPLQRAFGIEALELIENPQPDPRLRIEVRFTRAGSTAPASGTVADTLYADEPYDVWFRLHGPPHTDLYFSAMWAGYLEQPHTIYPAMTGLPKPIPQQQLGQWVKLPLLGGNEQRHRGPFGETQLVMYAGSTQYDFHRFVQTLPSCVDSSTRTTSEAGSGWLKTSHTVHLLPARAN